MRFHLLTCCVLLSSAAAWAAETPWTVSLKGGLLTEGEIHVDADEFEADFDTESSFMLIGDADRWVGEAFSVGVFVLYSNIEVDDWDAEATLLTAGITFKTRFSIGSGAELRPGIAIGYQRITPDDDDVDTITGLDIGAVVDLAFGGGDQSRFVGTIGFISQPAGGNDDLELTFEPILYLGGGLEFGG